MNSFTEAQIHASNCPQIQAGKRGGAHKHAWGCKVAGCTAVCAKFDCQHEDPRELPVKLGGVGNAHRQKGSKRPRAQSDTRNTADCASSVYSEVQVGDEGDYEQYMDVPWLSYNFSIARKDRDHLPGATKRGDPALAQHHPLSFSRLVTYVVKIFTIVCAIVFPGDPNALLVAAAKRVHKGKLFQADKFPKLFQAATQLFRHNLLKKRSALFRALRAILVTGLTAEDQDVVTAKGWLSLNGESRGNAYRDWECLSTTGTISHWRISRAKFADATIEALVMSILAPENVKTISWGKKLVKLDIYEWVALPNLVRTKPMHEMYKEYESDESITGRKLKKSTFHRVSVAITARGNKMYACVDYVLGALVNDAADTLQDIIDDATSGPTDPKRAYFTDHLMVARHYWKNEVDSHLRIEDDDVNTHGIEYALTCKAKDDSNNDHKKSGCAACQHTSVMCQELIDLVKASEAMDADQKNDAVFVIYDKMAGFEKYRAHRSRVVQQDDYLSGMDLAMKVDPSRCILDGVCCLCSRAFFFPAKALNPFMLFCHENSSLSTRLPANPPETKPLCAACL
jgi:hypothetical protein